MLAAGLVAVALCSGPGPAGAIAPTAEFSPASASRVLVAGDKVAGVARSGRLIVGDSLTVGASGALKKRGFKVNAKVARQFSTAPGILRGYRTLPRNVVIALGTNGTVSLATCKKVVRIAGKSRRVFLVNTRVPRSWEARNNRTLRRCDRSFAAGRVRVINWHRTSAGHPSWIAADGVHHTSRGRAAYMRAIDRAVDRYGK